MSPFRKRREQRKQREIERRKARRDALADRRGRPQEKPPTRPEARKRGDRPAGRKRVAAFLGASRNAFLSGARATGRRLGRAQPFVAWAANVAGRALRSVAVVILRGAAWIERVLRSGIGLLGSVLMAAATRLSRILTPERAVFAVTVAVAACLVVAQFTDYRGVEIDRSAYADVADIVRAPQVEVRTAGDAHAYLLIPLAVIAVGLAALALRRRRWQLGRLVSLCGLVSVAVVLFVDMPKGLDEGVVAIRYDGAEAVLREGFYAELVASIALVFCGLLLSLNLRQGRRPARSRRRERRRRARSSDAPSLARSGT